MRKLEKHDLSARRYAAATLLNTYNNSWREYQRARGDGTFEDVSNPVLTENEFAGRLRLSSASFNEGDCCDLFYDDD